MLISNLLQAQVLHPLLPRLPQVGICSLLRPWHAASWRSVYGILLKSFSPCVWCMAKASSVSSVHNLAVLRQSMYLAILKEVPCTLRLHHCQQSSLLAAAPQAGQPSGWAAFEDPQPHAAPAAASSTPHLQSAAASTQEQPKAEAFSGWQAFDSQPAQPQQPPSAPAAASGSQASLMKELPSVSALLPSNNVCSYARLSAPCLQGLVHIVGYCSPAKTCCCPSCVAVRLFEDTI